jgi:hypothetical protein
MYPAPQIRYSRVTWRNAIFVADTPAQLIPQPGQGKRIVVVGLHLGIADDITTAIALLSQDVGAHSAAKYEWITTNTYFAPIETSTTMLWPENTNLIMVAEGATITFSGTLHYYLANA